MAGPPNELFIFFSFTSFVLSSIPFYWHLQAWNVGTCLLMAWLSLGSLNAMINAIIWNHNIINWAPVWCDISTRFLVGLNVGLPAAVLVIMIRLYKIASLTKASMTPAEKRRDVIIDLAIGLGIPLIQMPLQYVIQGNRFDIWEDFGCFWVAYPTWLTWLLFYPWPFLISCAAMAFGAMAYWHIRKRAIQFQEFMSSNRSMNQSQYLRLMAMTAVVLTIMLADNIAILIEDAGIPLNPWISWDDTHFNFSETPGEPRVLMPPTAVLSLELQRWMIVFGAYIFFCLLQLLRRGATALQQVLLARQPEWPRIPPCLLRRKQPGHAVWLELSLAHKGLPQGGHAAHVLDVLRASSCIAQHTRIQTPLERLVH